MIEQLVTLGPAGTFSERAAQHFQQQLGDSVPIVFKSTLADVLHSVNDTQLAVAPIENLIDGFVSPVVDYFAHHPLYIHAEYRLPIQYHLLANSEKPEQVWAQFVAAGQCHHALNTLSLPIVHTASNTASLNELIAADKPSAAIVPSHIPCPEQLHCIQRTIADSHKNQTRFVLLSAHAEPLLALQDRRWKSSVMLIDDNDHPGLLVDSLKAFAEQGINLTSIVSRPTGDDFGQYHFFIDFDGHEQDPSVQKALKKLAELNQIRWLGSYPAFN